MRSLVVEPSLRKYKLPLAAAKVGAPDPKKIPNTDLVFRITCWEHIPMAPKKVPKSQQKKKKIEDIFEFDEPEDDPLAGLVDEPVLDTTHMRVNFPPFWHYRINEDKSRF